MADAQLWVLVDDTSPQVQYHDNVWFTDIGSLDVDGPYGSPYRRTMHGTNSSTRLSFTFTGSSVNAFGSVPSDSGLQWECKVDGNALGSNPHSEAVGELCPWKTLSDEEHTFTLEVTSDRGGSLWFDFFQYVPSDKSLNNGTVKIPCWNTDLQFDQSWTAVDLAQPMRITSQKGGQLNYTFEGASLEWYGAFPMKNRGKPTSGSYSVDGEQSKSFELHGDVSHDLIHVKLFETPRLLVGKHTLSVTFDGDSSTAPLLLHYFVVQTGTDPDSPTPTLTSEHATSTRSTHVTASRATATGSITASPKVSLGSAKPNIGGIVGGVVGGIGISVLLLVLALRYRWQNSRIRSETDTEAMPFPISTISQGQLATLSDLRPRVGEQWTSKQLVRTPARSQDSPPEYTP